MPVRSCGSSWIRFRSRAHRARIGPRPASAAPLPRSDATAPRRPAPNRTRIGMIRRLQLLAIAAVVVVAAFSTGLPFLFYLVYLGVLVVGGSYVLTRLALVNLEAGYAVSQLYGHVGDQLRVTYTLRNTG